MTNIGHPVKRIYADPIREPVPVEPAPTIVPDPVPEHEPA